jgi:hypothetical protein
LKNLVKIFENFSLVEMPSKIDKETVLTVANVLAHCIESIVPLSLTIGGLFLFRNEEKIAKES